MRLRGIYIKAGEEKEEKEEKTVIFSPESRVDTCQTFYRDVNADVKCEGQISEESSDGLESTKTEWTTGRVTLSRNVR